MSDPDRKPVETPAAWLRFADENRAVAEREMATDDPAYHTICFLCQSAAEKYLKGYLIAQGWTLEKTHDLVALLTRCADYEERFAPLREGGAILNEYIVAGRYPGDVAYEDIGDEEAREALAVVRRIEREVRTHMNRSR
jgi:HEPN domain-containing protein